jgi:hypothetical protein
MGLFDWSIKQKKKKQIIIIIIIIVMGKHPYYTNLSPFLAWANTTPYGVPNDLIVGDE